MENKVITLRNVYGKMKEVHIQPCRQQNGARFPWVKPVRYDSMGNSELIMSDEERNSEESRYFLAEDEDIVIIDGTTFNLNDPLQYNKWMAIRDSDIIVPTRDTRDKNGDLCIDGNKKRYGLAEFYVDIPGEDSEKSVSKKKKITKAYTYIGQDSVNGRLTKCKLLGKYMENAPESDVEDYLYQVAEKNPDQVLELYQSSDMKLKLLIIDAKAKGIIIKKDGMFNYADNILGATDDAMILFLKMPSNDRIRKMIANETYPEYASISYLENKLAAPKVVEDNTAEETVDNEAEEEQVKKTTKKK